MYIYMYIYDMYIYIYHMYKYIYTSYIPFVGFNPSQNDPHQPRSAQHQHATADRSIIMFFFQRHAGRAFLMAGSLFISHRMKKGSAG